MESSLLTIPEAAALLRLKVSTIRAWTQKRRLPFVRLGRRVFIRRSDVQTMIQANLVPARDGAEVDR